MNYPGLEMFGAHQDLGDPNVLNIDLKWVPKIVYQRRLKIN